MMDPQGGNNTHFYILTKISNIWNLINLTIKRRRGKSGKKGDHGLVGSPGLVGQRGKPVNFLIVKKCINNKNRYSTKYIYRV
jgi:hypothetical protein